MVKIGFPIPRKRNERRRALIPGHVPDMPNPDNLVLETGYGEVLGYRDEDYRKRGCVVASRDVVCDCPVICIPKAVPTDEYFQAGKTVFGWIHAVQGRRMTDVLVQHKMTAIAWEEMFENGRHTFWRNQELSGEAAVAQAFLEWGRVPYECKVAVVGRGNVARGAMRALERAGTAVMVYDRKTSPTLRHDIGRYDVIVNAVRWDVFRTDHIVYEEDLEKMKPGSLIIDVSCDEGMGIESSHPTSIKQPVYWHKGILHYAVDHTPTLFFQTASQCISEALSRFLPGLVKEEPNGVLEAATIIRNGEILDEHIVRFQKR